MKPLCVDLFAGSFGWSAGWLEFGGRVIGFDIEHESHHGPVPHGADLVLQDVRTINGAQFKDASLILASPPCQVYSYMSMPWTRAKRIAQALTVLKFAGDDSNHPPFPDGYTGPQSIAALNELFEACFRIQREAIAAAGRFIPLVVENVRGAQPWVGRARWMYGSYALWGDVPALMPITTKQRKVKMASWRHPSDPRHVKGQGFNTLADQQTKAEDFVKVGGPRGDDWFTHHNRQEFEDRVTKNSGGSWFNVAHNTTSGKGQNPDGRLIHGRTDFSDDGGQDLRRMRSDGAVGTSVLRGDDVHLFGVQGSGAAVPDGWKVASESGRRTDVGNGVRFTSQDCGIERQLPTEEDAAEGRKQRGSGREWFAGEGTIGRTTGSKSNARKAASARIARIPYALSLHIARCYFPSSR